MKKILFYLAILISLVSFSSCATILTSPTQPITFAGEDGIKIFNTKTNSKIAEIGKENTITVKMKKGLENMNVIAKKEGYKNQYFTIQSSFDAVAICNIFFWPGFLVDFVTGQIYKYDDSLVNIELERE